MSSTNRTRSRDSHISDYYRTPEWAIDDFLRNFLPHCDEKINNKCPRIFDPCAGGDSKNPMMYPYVLKQYDFLNITTNDIRWDSPAVNHDNFLITEYCSYKWDWIISNPPFNLAQEFIEKALSLVYEEGWVTFLLRLNFLGSEKRKQFWQKNPPKYIFVHSKRMSFTDNGKTDSIEYMHCCWQKGFKGDTILRII